MLALVDSLNKFIRPLVLVLMTGTVVYLALTGHDRAMEALIAQFIAVTAFFFGERAGAQIPQQLPQERREGS